MLVPACVNGGSRRSRAACLPSIGATVAEMAEPEICCGFGGTFCVKYPEISVRMVSDKARDIAATGASTVLAGDLGCLLNIAGRLTARGAHGGRRAMSPKCWPA